MSADNICILKFLFQFSTDTGATNPFGLLGLLSNALSTYNTNKPGTGELQKAASDFFICSETPIGKRAKSILETFSLIAIILVIVSIIFIVTLLSFLFYSLNPYGAIFLILLYVIMLIAMYYYINNKMAGILTTFNQDLQPCIAIISKAVEKYESDQIKAIESAICPSS